MTFICDSWSGFQSSNSLKNYLCPELRCLHNSGQLNPRQFSPVVKWCSESQPFTNSTCFNHPLTSEHYQNTFLLGLSFCSTGSALPSLLYLPLSPLKCKCTQSKHGRIPENVHRLHINADNCGYPQVRKSKIQIFTNIRKCSET